MVEKLMKSSTTSVYPTFPDSDAKLAEKQELTRTVQILNCAATATCRCHNSSSINPIKLQLALLESLSNDLQLYYRTFFQIMELHLSKTVGN